LIPGGFQIKIRNGNILKTNLRIDGGAVYGHFLVALNLENRSIIAQRLVD
jgi:hypothetical protein